MDLKNIITNQSKGFCKIVWWMLQEIQKTVDANINETITLPLSDVQDDTPTKNDQRKALTFLQKINAIDISHVLYSSSSMIHSIKEMQNTFGGASNKSQLYKLTITAEIFSSTYNLYEKSNKPKDTISFNRATGTLNTKDNEVRFKLNSKSCLVLDALFNINDEYYSLGELLDFTLINKFITVTGANDEINQRAFYSVRDHVNKKMLTKIGYKKFLIIDNKCIRINEKYLQKH